MKTGGKEAILIMMVIVVLTVYISYTQLGHIEDLKANEVQNDMIDCIQDHDSATSTCVEICEGTRNNNRYPFIEELDSHECRSYVIGLIERFDL
ncbi:MAG: hypothetical protein WBL67_17000 [Nitrososphaeraceae archaeon]